jgi:hypothetical protein
LTPEAHYSVVSALVNGQLAKRLESEAEAEVKLVEIEVAC